jgi:hypothetical protein
MTHQSCYTLPKTHRISQQVLTLSRKKDECKALVVGLRRLIAVDDPSPTLEPKPGVMAALFTVGQHS